MRTAYFYWARATTELAESTKPIGFSAMRLQPDPMPDFYLQDVPWIWKSTI